MSHGSTGPEPSDGPTRDLRVLVLWVQLSGYLDACLRALGARDGISVRVAYQRPSSSAPFDLDRFASARGGYGWHDAPDPEELRSLVEQYRPDAVLVSSWSQPAYLALARELAGRALRVVCFDNQWAARPRQLLGVATSRRHLQPSFDVAFFPGAGQARFARYLGFPDRLQLHGLYCGDHDRFSAVCPPAGTNRAKRFLFVGRLVEEKGVDVLAEAYARYRASTPGEPWPLEVAGVGPLEGRLSGIPGVELRGFLQPDDLPAVFAGAGCLVLPSRFEPWGVVVHEAAAAGLPVIATQACGAASRLVLDGYNGLLAEPGHVGSLTTALTRMSGYGDERLRAMGEASASLARQYTPTRWADYLVERLRGFGARWGHPPVLP